MSSAIDLVCSALATTTGYAPTRRGDALAARCPAHDDRNPSLVVRDGDRGVVLFCHSGCTTPDILKALGLEWSDLFNEPLASPTGAAHPSKQIECTYDYTDEDNNLLFQVLRYTPKGFAQRKPKDDGDWEYRLGDIRRPLFRLPEIIEAVSAGRWILLCEGEKDVLRLAQEGFAATTTPGGSGAFKHADVSALAGAKVAIIPDNDDPGRKYAIEAAERLASTASYVTIVELDTLPNKGDVSDWLALPGSDATRLRQLITDSPQYEPRAAQTTQQDLKALPNRLEGKPGVHHAEEAEREIIAAALSHPEVLLDVASELAPEDFYTSKWQACWAAFLELFGERGIAPDAITMADSARTHGAVVAADELKILQDNALGVTEGHVDMVRKAKASRDVISLCKQTLATVTSGGDPYDAIEELTRFDRAVTTFSRQPQAISVDQFIEESADASPWVIPGLVRQDTTGIIIASEGIGKAVNLRTIAMCLAQGRHPFTHDKIEPVRTMIVDAENSRFSITETARTLSTTLQINVGQDYDPERCHIWHQPQGLNLIRRTDRAALQREIAHHRPGLVIMGPLYDLFRRGERDTYESAADALLDVFDDLRIKYKFALLLEHHAPKGNIGSTRVLMPADSMRFLQWPELGITLREDEDSGSLVVGRYRGDRIHVLWPDRIDRDPAWLVSGWYQNGFKVDW